MQYSPLVWEEDGVQKAEEGRYILNLGSVGYLLVLWQFLFSCGFFSRVLRRLVSAAKQKGEGNGIGFCSVLFL